MKNKIQPVWNTPNTQRLAQVLADIDNVYEMQNFLRDVMTEKEIIEISARYKAAQMLLAGSKYSDIVAATKLSSRTVARISDWLKNGTGGYKIALMHHEHMSPAHAE